MSALQFLPDDFGYEEAGNDEEDIYAKVPAWKKRAVHVERDHRQDCDGSQAVDIGTVSASVAALLFGTDVHSTSVWTD